MIGKASKVADLVRNEWPLILAAVVAFVLRTWQLPAQIISGDEWHCVRKVAGSGYLGIMTSFGRADHCIPLTLLYELASRTIGLSEMVMHLPMLLVGMLAVVCVPLMLRSQIGRPASYLLAGLIAISPMQVFYSRFARPYGITSFLGVCALVLFLKWWGTKRRSYAVLYVIVAVACVYLHVLTGAFVLAPFVFYVARSLFSRADRWSKLRRVFLPGLCAVVLLVVLIGPAIVADYDVFTVRTSNELSSISAVVSAWPGLVGMNIMGIAIALVLPTIWGAVHLRKSRLFQLAAVASVLQIVGVYVTGVRAAASPLIMARYIFCVQPFLLAIMAVGFVGLSQQMVRQRARLGHVLGILLCTTLFAVGPLLVVFAHSSSWFANHLWISMVGKRQAYHDVIKVPGFYKQLADLKPERAAIVESLCYLPIRQNPLPAYETAHRRRTLVGIPDCGPPQAKYRWRTTFLNPGMRFRNMIRLSDIEGLARSGASYVILHRQLRSEIEDFARLLNERIRRMPTDILSCIELYRERLGQPVYEDDKLVVFQLPESS